MYTDNSIDLDSPILHRQIKVQLWLTCLAMHSILDPNPLESQTDSGSLPSNHRILIVYLSTSITPS